MDQDRTAWVVGASRSLGLALAREWCGRGWQVVATVRTSSDQLEKLRTQYPGQLEIEMADILNPDSIQALRGRLEGGASTCCSSTPASPAPSRCHP
jgi:NAD(P)-dependent dehydrogenase (short-subunit alcohol dehydrogenase family)